MTELGLDVGPATGPKRAAVGRAAWLAAAALATELVAISFLYRNAVHFECSSTATPELCHALAAAPASALSVLIALLTLRFAGNPALGRFLGRVHEAADRRWLLVHAAGFCLFLVPLAFIADAPGPARTALALAIWGVGAVTSAVGMALAIAPAAAWRGLLLRPGAALPLVVMVALAAPALGRAAQEAWLLGPVANLTFDAVAGLLEALGADVVADPAKRIIGVGEFSVSVWITCSGVEGFALITGFTTLYIWAFRDRLHVARALWLFPIGILLSWSLNVLRISALIAIGAAGSPELAVGGFHSHAGWLAFTLLAVSFMLAAHSVPWLRRAEPDAPETPEAPAILQDPIAACILPFVVFMAASLLTSTFSSTPALLYPAKAAAMAAAIWAFRGIYRAMDWRLDVPAVAAGLAIGALWVATAPAGAAEESALALALAELPQHLLIAWIAFRVAGTVLLVPLIEEMFFRGYILRRLDFGGPAMRVAAILVSSVLFALLHDRMVAAGLSGVVFALLVLRRGEVAPAVQAHAAANATIAAWAMATGDWAVI